MLRSIIYLFFILCIYLFACKEERAPVAPPSRNGSPTIDTISKQLVQQPNNDSLYALRAENYYSQDLFDEAIADLKKALAIDSLNPNYQHLLADVYLDATNSRMALKTLEHTARLYPNRPATLLKLAEFQLILKKHQEALKTVGHILAVSPQNAEAYFMMGMTFKELGDTTRAIRAFQAATDYKSELLDAWLNLGILYDAKKNPLALKCFDNVLRLDSTSAEALHGKAMFFQHQNKIKEAIATYQHINRIQPQYPEAYYNLGLLYLDKKDWTEAHRNFDIAIKVSPTFVNAYYYRGLVAEQQGRLKEAKQDYRQATSLSPNFKLAQEGYNRIKN